MAVLCAAQSRGSGSNECEQGAANDGEHLLNLLKAKQFVDHFVERLGGVHIYRSGRSLVAPFWSEHKFDSLVAKRPVDIGALLETATHESVVGMRGDEAERCPNRAYPREQAPVSRRTTPSSSSRITLETANSKLPSAHGETHREPPEQPCTQGVAGSSPAGSIRVCASGAGGYARFVPSGGYLVGRPTSRPEQPNADDPPTAMLL